jgi:hypothetical protein
VQKSYFFSMPIFRKTQTLSFTIFATSWILAVALTGCASRNSEPQPFAAPAWRLVPEATVIGEKRQFFLYGRHLDSAEITVTPTVTLEKGTLKPDGRVLSLYITTSPLRTDTLVRGEKLGSREIHIKTPDTSAVFTLKVVDESQPR